MGADHRALVEDRIYSLFLTRVMHESTYSRFPLIWRVVKLADTERGTGERLSLFKRIYRTGELRDLAMTRTIVRMNS